MPGEVGVMEIREFAEKVLLAESLEGKLQRPAAGLILTDEEPGGRGPAVVPDVPGRPAGLHFSGRGEGVRLPRADELHGEEARAVLLHAFANHELLAVELMALALLKFPAAPPAFRRGLLRTLGEEQEHTRLYMERMAAAGLRLGDLPVNGFFWRSIADMETPLDYVSRLSLTFEQANLDYARHYGALFRRMGDAATGDLLDRIYRDEIAHVGYGLKWFRRWKEPGVSDWDAWSRRLVFPLSPARAKGNAPFNREGRRRAGLEEEFIGALDLFSHSRGRTPWVGVFNPAAEACALTNDPATAARETTTGVLARDLDLLPIFSLNAEDVVLVRRIPGTEHLQRLRAAGIPLPQFEKLERGGGLSGNSFLSGRKLGRLRPWAWSADSAALLAPLLPNTGEAAFASIPWDGEIRELYSKATAAAAAQRLGADLGLPEETWGTVAYSEAEVRAAAGELAGRGYAMACLKAPFGIAGRGVVRVPVAGLTEQALTWLRPVLHQQGAVVVEPWLDRIADFSSQYELQPGSQPRLKGQVHLMNDAGGRFLGCRAAPAFTRLLPPEAARCLQESGADRIYREVLPRLLRELPGLSRLHGGLGVDAFVYRTREGKAALRPLVEINPRTTMGRVTLDLRRFADPSRVTGFRILHRRALAAAGYPGLLEYARYLEEKSPAVTGRTASGGRLVSGSLVLNDPAAAEAFLAVLSVGPGAGEYSGLP